MVQRSFLALILLILAFSLNAQIADEVATEDTLEQEPDSTETATEPRLPKVDREQVETWIALDRDYRNPYLHGMLREPSTNYNSLDIYRANYHSLGINSKRLGIRRNGFSLLPGMWSEALYLQVYDNFSRQSLRLGEISFSEDKYPYPVMLSNIQAALGDYEYNYARGSVKKTGLFGNTGLYNSFDFLVQTGLWTGLDHDQSSIRDFFELDLGAVSFEMEILSWAQDNSSQDLLPVYWGATNISLDHKLSHFYLGMNSNGLDLGMLLASETIILPGDNIRNRYWQYRVSKDIALGKHSLDLAYERANQRLDFSPINTAGSRSFKDLIRADYDYNGELLKAQISGRFYDWEDPAAQAKLSIHLLGLNPGIYVSYNGLEPRAFMVEDAFFGGLDRDAQEQFITSDYAAILNTDSYYGISARLQGGLRSFKKAGVAITGTGDYSTQQDLPYFDLMLGYGRSFGTIDLSLKQTVNYQSQDEAQQSFMKLTEIPQWRYQSSMILQKNLPRHNAIRAGLSIWGHSDYYLPIVTPVLIEGSAITDIWAGVQISRLFDFTVAFKNIFDTDLYATYPIPRSLHASLSWYFLN